MRVPTPAQLLDLWDEGVHALPIDRARLLLCAAWPEQGPIDSWPLGLANARLLELRAALFAPRWECVATCPQCGVVAEVVLDLPAMLSAAATFVSVDSQVVSGGNWSVAFRVPTVGDVFNTVHRYASGEHLLECVILSAASQGQPLAAGELTNEMRAAVDRSVSEADPLATIDVVVQCPSCTNQWREFLDVIALLWTEISAAAKGLISEVAQLALAFGWSEPEVLALPSRRRRQYLELLHAQQGAV
jgi:hypothetical protein